MHHTYIMAIYKAVLAMEWNEPLKNEPKSKLYIILYNNVIYNTEASKDYDMHIVCHFSAVVPTDSFAE